MGEGMGEVKGRERGSGKGWERGREGERERERGSERKGTGGVYVCVWARMRARACVRKKRGTLETAASGQVTSYALN